MLWRSCIGPPSQPKLALSLPIKGPSFCRLTVVGGSENRTTSLRSMEMHPFWCCAPLPPVGKVCSPLFLVLTYVAHFIAPLESPPPGWQANTIRREPQATENRVRRFPVERRRQRRQKGCISHARQGGWLVFHRAKPGCTVLSILAPSII